MSDGDVLRAFTAMQKSISDPEYENISGYQHGSRCVRFFV